jgi:hypothetical protein
MLCKRGMAKECLTHMISPVADASVILIYTAIRKPKEKARRCLTHVHLTMWRKSKMNQKQALDIIYCIISQDDWEFPYAFELVKAVMEDVN